MAIDFDEAASYFMHASSFSKIEISALADSRTSNKHLSK